MTPPTWMEHAACRSMGPYLFFGAEIETGPARDTRTAEAKAVCAHCPVRVNCLEWAMACPTQIGIAGGTTAQERAAERRSRRTRKAS